MGKVIKLFKERGGNAMPNIYDVALAFLKLESMTHKKLQKLCYYAYAWHLVIFGRRLCDTRFEAWVHGPVSSNLYHYYKNYGGFFIPKSDEELNLGDQLEEFIKAIYKLYGHMTADELEALTHNEEPWKKTRGNCTENELCDRRIEDQLMVDFYSEKL